ncbi:hypothetical protein IAD21_00622 [Abditibacteriota bacterium]|nr:hypothetical protein IAD21_00622 [Abditibacteriota bacterium]
MLNGAKGLTSRKRERGVKRTVTTTALVLPSVHSRFRLTSYLPRLKTHDSSLKTQNICVHLCLSVFICV